MPKRSSTGAYVIAKKSKYQRSRRYVKTRVPAAATAAARTYASSLPRKRATGLSSTLEKAIKAVIDNGKEKKLDVLLPTGSNQSVRISSQTAASGPDFFLLLPGPSLGTGDNDRIGNELTITQCNLRFMLQAGSALAADVPQPVLITMMIGRLKEGFRIPDDTDWGNMFVNENGAPFAAPANQLASAMSPVNEDYFDIKLRKQYKLGNAAVSNFNGYIHNNDFNTFYQENIDVSKYMKKKIRYNDGDTTPQNEGLYVWFIQHPIDGTVLTGDALPLLAATLTTRYTDA